MTGSPPPQHFFRFLANVLSAAFSVRLHLPRLCEWECCSYGCFGRRRHNCGWCLSAGRWCLDGHCLRPSACLLFAGAGHRSLRWRDFGLVLLRLTPLAFQRNLHGSLRSNLLRHEVSPLPPSKPRALNRVEYKRGR